MSRLMLIKAMVIVVCLVNSYGTGSKSAYILLSKSVCVSQEITLSIVTLHKLSIE